MDEARRTILLAELEDAKRARDRLAVFIDVLSERVGVSAAETGGNSTGQDPWRGVDPFGTPSGGTVPASRTGGRSAPSS